MTRIDAIIEQVEGQAALDLHDTTGVPPMICIHAGITVRSTA